MTSVFIVLAVGVRILSNSLTNVFQKKLVARFPHALLINALAYLILGALLVPRAFFLRLGELPRPFWGWSLLVGLCGACGNGFMVKALERGQLSVLGPINAWKPVIGMLGGALLLAELPSAGGLAGLALIVWGSYWILGADEGGFRWRVLLRRDIRFRVCALFFTALEAVFIKKAILLSSAEAAFVLWCWSGALFSLPAGILMSRGRIRPAELSGALRNLLLLALLALCFGVMQYATNIVFRLIPVGPGLALFQLSAAVNLWLGWRLFHERDMRRKIFGTVLTVAGAALIILFP